MLTVPIELDYTQGYPAVKSPSKVYVGLIEVSSVRVVYNYSTFPYKFYLCFIKTANVSPRFGYRNLYLNGGFWQMSGDANDTYWSTTAAPQCATSTYGSYPTHTYIQEWANYYNGTGQRDAIPGFRGKPLPYNYNNPVDNYMPQFFFYSVILCALIFYVLFNLIIKRLHR